MQGGFFHDAARAARRAAGAAAFGQYGRRAMAGFNFHLRLKAMLIHFGGSLLLAAGALGLVYGLWYPAPLAAAVGVSGIVLLLLGVDVVLGPMLTFAVYQPGKKSLRLDLAVIVAVQLAAFGYGMATIAQGRPAWLVFNADRFDVVQASDLDTRYLDEALPEFRRPAWTGPRWVASVNPEDVEKRNQLVLESAGGGSDLPQRVDLYRALETETANLRARAKPLPELEQFNEAAAVQAALSAWSQADAWLPLMARAEPMVVLIDTRAGAPLAIVGLHPW